MQFGLDKGFEKKMVNNGVGRRPIESCQDSSSVLELRESGVPMTGVASRSGAGVDDLAVDALNALEAFNQRDTNFEQRADYLLTVRRRFKAMGFAGVRAYDVGISESLATWVGRASLRELAIALRKTSRHLYVGADQGIEDAAASDHTPAVVSDKD